MRLLIPPASPFPQKDFCIAVFQARPGQAMADAQAARMLHNRTDNLHPLLAAALSQGL
jgi:hypothetical protein